MRTIKVAQPTRTTSAVRAFDHRPANSISKDVLDNADDALQPGQVSSPGRWPQRQYELTKAGAWSYRRGQPAASKYDALVQQAYLAAQALLQKYTLKAQADGVVLAVNTASGSYVSPQGSYDAYTQAQDPLIVMSAPQTTLAVRCYVDEILVSRLPAGAHIQAQMSIRGTDVKVPLEFVRVQPYVSPKIELSDQRQEQVDLRVLPVVFRFKMTSPTMAYPGQLVDVFIGPK
jgi:HlyD family secretion protein